MTEPKNKAGIPINHCQWNEDEDGNWFTDCNNAFTFNEGSPSDNKMQFCPYCGKLIYQRDHEWEQEQPKLIEPLETLSLSVTRGVVEWRIAIHDLLNSAIKKQCEIIDRLNELTQNIGD